MCVVVEVGLGRGNCICSFDTFESMQSFLKYYSPNTVK